MRHYVSCLLFLLTAGGVHLFNARQTGEVLAFPFITSIVPSTAGSPVAMGESTVHLLLAISGLLFLWGAFKHWRASSYRDTRNGEDEAA
ncbi:MAG: hypothetical protein GY913_01240 [Proteobacteria bacterium]|nr:hypothetical protein [Pseudomonadota bacterium]MCP4915523.1 hypothetical protein [Pseudomonadota bacterium]